MRLEDNFYKIHAIEQIENDYKIEVELMPTHPIYAGHFPEQPVVPGVCTLTIIRECIGKILSKSVSFATIKECKYVSALIPEEGLKLIINLTLSADGGVKAVVERVSDNQIALKLKASLKQ
jgi:3-hydroxyacyl-[acyl-carrier-protein] dehydratase